MAGEVMHGRPGWPCRLPLGFCWHAMVSTVQGQGRPPGQAVQEGSVMTGAAVSFAGNLTEDPEVRHTEGGIVGPCSGSPPQGGGSRRRRASPWSCGRTRPSTWPRSWGRASAGRRQRPGRRAAPSGRRLDQRCDGAGRGRSMLAFRTVQQSNHCAGEEVLYELRARPAVGRLRRPSSPGQTKIAPDPGRGECSTPTLSSKGRSHGRPSKRRTAAPRVRGVRQG
jgi:hypothetical protein